MGRVLVDGGPNAACIARCNACMIFELVSCDRVANLSFKILTVDGGAVRRIFVVGRTRVVLFADGFTLQVTAVP